MNDSFGPPLSFPQRKKPAPYQCPDDHNPPIVFLTVCTKDRRPILANHSVHDALRALWRDRAHWAVGYYVIMPDHIHLLARVASRNAYSLRRWVGWWKRELSKAMEWTGTTVWQQAFWDRNIFSATMCDQKLEYMRHNPVHAKLVATRALWLFQGVIYNLGSLDR